MTSLWHLTSPPIEVDPEPPRRADVAVVGAGIAGLATAALLARAGRSVTALEAREVGAVATGNTTAKLSLLQSSVYADLLQHAGREALEAYVAANRAAQEWVRGELAGDDQLERRDAFTYATTDSGAEAVEAEAAALAAAGVETDDLLAGQDAGLPFPVVRAIRMRDQWQIHPMRLLARLAASVREHGGSVVTGCRVTGLSDGVLQTSRGDLEADHVVVASGSPVIDRGGFFARLTASRSLVGAYRVPGDVPSGMYVSLDPEGRSLRTSQGRLLVGGSGWVPGRSREVGRMLAELDAWTATAFPGAERETWWAAQDYRTLSRVPFAGPVGEGLSVATGFNKWGMTNGIAAALAISGDLRGEPAPWAPALRAPHLALGSFVSAQASVASAAVSGIVRHGVAPERVCTHLGGILEWNDLECTWDCPLHASRFGRSGEVLEGPATRDLPTR